MKTPFGARNPAMRGGRKLDYICMQPTRQGQASYAHAYEIVAGLRRRGWRVRMVEPAQPRPGAMDGARRALAAATSQLAYVASCRPRPASIVYVRTHFLSLPAAALARMAGSIVVQEINGPFEDGFDAWPALRRIRRAIEWSIRVQVRWADAVIVVTPGLAGYIAGATGRHSGFEVIGNGADVDLFRPDVDHPTTGRPYVAFVGALASWQGLEVVLDATMSTDWPPGVDLVIAGDGRERDRVEAAVRATDRIRWLTSVPYQEVPALVAGAMAALVPMTDSARSQYGLSPLKLFEAMACGVPVVASDLPGLAEVVQGAACGVTVPAGDSIALAAAVRALAEDLPAARAMGARGRAAAVAQYSWDARAGQTDTLLRRLAAERVARRRRGRMIRE